MPSKITKVSEVREVDHLPIRMRWGEILSHLELGDSILLRKYHKHRFTGVLKSYQSWGLGVIQRVTPEDSDLVRLWLDRSGDQTWDRKTSGPVELAYKNFEVLGYPEIIKVDRNVPLMKRGRKTMISETLDNLKVGQAFTITIEGDIFSRRKAIQNTGKGRGMKFATRKLGNQLTITRVE